MNRDIILNTPQINGGAKKLVREHVQTEYDSATGEISRTIEQKAIIPKEPDYIKIYTDCMLVINNINPALSPFIIAFSRWMTYAIFLNLSIVALFKQMRLYARMLLLMWVCQMHASNKPLKS